MTAFGTPLFRGILLAVLITLTGSPELLAQATDPERSAELARRGAGLRIGLWQVQDLRDLGGNVDDRRSPVFEGYFQRGLDMHLAIESTVGVWRRSRRETTPGGPISGSTYERVDTYVIPAFTALKLYPFTRPEGTLEPHVGAGVGLAIGVDDREATGGLFAPGSGMRLATGFGFQGLAGVDYRFSRAFGLHLSGQYRWIRFTENLGGERLYRGFGLSGGLVYRFQFE